MLTAPLRRAVAIAVAGSAALAVLAAGSAAQAAAPPEVRAAEQAQLRAIGVTAAWQVTRGSGVTVGVLDSGVDPTVPDLAGSVTVGPDYTQGADPPGYQPPHLHGTYIASLIAGHGSGPGDTAGVIGVAPAARILSVRVILDDQEPGFANYNDNSAYADAIGNGIRYAVGHGVEVINMSLGGETPSRDLRAAVGYAIAHGVVVVSAAGNSGMDTRGYTPYSYPASFPGVISVAALDATGHRALFSDQNASVVLSAPGVNVVGAGPDGSYLVGRWDEPRVGVGRRRGGADPVALPPAQPGAGRAGDDLLGQRPAGQVTAPAPGSAKSTRPPRSPWRRGWPWAAPIPGWRPACVRPRSRAHSGRPPGHRPDRRLRRGERGPAPRWPGPADLAHCPAPAVPVGQAPADRAVEKNATLIPEFPPCPKRAGTG